MCRSLPLLLAVLIFCLTLVYYNGYSNKFYFGNLLQFANTIASNVEHTFSLQDRIQFRSIFDNVEYIGLPFNKSWNKYLQKFGLLNVGEIDDAQVLMSEPVFVTAFSDNHYHEAQSMMTYLLKRYNGAKKLYVYELGLSEKNRKELMKNYSSLIIDLRTFPFDLYPEHVNRYTYRWKPLVIAQMLSEHPSVLWMDTSAKMKGQIKTVYSDFKNCSSQDLQSCKYYPWVMMDNSSHSIYSATGSGMYAYLPIPETVSKNLTMFGANLQLIYAVKHVKENVLKFWVLCALEPDCMAPKEAKLSCQFKNSYSDYGNCHRYDQSASNILLAWANNFRENLYHHDMDKAFVIERNGK